MVKPSVNSLLSTGWHAYKRAPEMLTCSSRCSSLHPPTVIWLVWQGKDMPSLDSKLQIKAANTCKLVVLQVTASAHKILWDPSERNSETDGIAAWRQVRQVLLIVVNCKKNAKGLAEATPTPENHSLRPLATSCFLDVSHCFTMSKWHRDIEEASMAFDHAKTEHILGTKWNKEFWDQCSLVRPDATCVECSAIAVRRCLKIPCFVLICVLLFWTAAVRTFEVCFGPAESWRPGSVKGYPNPDQEHHQRWNPWSTGAKISVWHEISAWLSVCQPLIEGAGNFLFRSCAGLRALKGSADMSSMQWRKSPLIALNQNHSQETVAAMNLISAQLSPPWPCELE